MGSTNSAGQGWTAITLDWETPPEGKYSPPTLYRALLAGPSGPLRPESVDSTCAEGGPAASHPWQYFLPMLLPAVPSKLAARGKANLLCAARRLLWSCSAGSGNSVGGGSGGGDGWLHLWGQRQQGAAAHGGGGPTVCTELEHSDWGHLYSLHATEWQQQHYLQYAAATGAHGERTGTAADEDPTAGMDDSFAEECEYCGSLPTEPDFYEQESDFRPDHQLVLRSAWLCAGASSLADMRQRLEERIRFLQDLEADGWQLEAPVDDQYACLHNVNPKPQAERRLVSAWEIVEHWEQSVDWERWEGRDD